ncbi:MAG: hypothetical protein JW908_07065 [Anaerolineales bacterium]|nr:hypothetical protein [Anaerolineales bacterium]
MTKNQIQNPPQYYCFLLVAFLGIFFTSLGYSHGTGNQIVQMPMVIRVINPAFLSNDFFVNVTSTYNPQFFYAQFIGLLAKVFPLAYVVLFLTIITNILTAWITFLFGRDLFKNNMAGALAACIVMGVDCFDLGAAAIIRTNYLIPGTLIMPLILLSLWAALRQKPIISICLAGLAAIIHPLLGLETGGICVLIISTTQIFLRKLLSKNESIRINKIVISGLIYCVVSAAFLIPEATQTHIDSMEFIHILANFRCPHHYIPSTFNLINYAGTLSFFIAAAIAWKLWQNKVSPPISQAIGICMISIIVLFLCIGGYVFVEIFPSRLWTTAQPFRLLLLPKWFGEVLISGIIALHLQENKKSFVAYLSLVSLLTPLTIGIPPFFSTIKTKVKQFFPAIQIFFEPGATLLLVTLLLLCFQPGLRVVITLFLFVFLFLVLFYLPKEFFLSLTGLGVFLLLIISIYRIPIRNAFGMITVIPRIAFVDLTGEEIEVAKFARENSNSNDIFLTPPNFGQFRLTAERAIVVDYKAFPFRDKPLQEWYTRIIDCYGPAKGRNPNLRNDLEQNFKNIDDEKLITLQRKYDFTYVVLFSETKTIFPVLFQTDTYKIIEFDNNTH